MKIRTRYTLFKIIIALAVVTFLLSLWDIFGNVSEWFVPIMIVYIALAVFALILYIGYKPNLDDETPPAVSMGEPVPAVVPLAPREPLHGEGINNFRCPFCANVFALELTHLKKEHELRMDCPFCSNRIRIPARPKLSPGQGVSLEGVQPQEQATFVCANCGEMLRYTALGQRTEDHVHVHSCPHCGSERVDPAAGAAA